MKIIPAKYHLDLSGSAYMEGEDLIHNTTYFDEVADYYANANAAQARGHQESYRVCYAIGNRTMTDLYYGTTTIQPLLIDGESNMTKGHFHDEPKYMEYYLCVKGNGYLLKWDGDETCFAEEMKQGSLHYIEGKYAHRVINTGEEELIFLAVDSATGGAKYDRIKEVGFPVRCFKQDGKIIWKDNR